MNRLDVEFCIVGAGFAGLAAARRSESGQGEHLVEGYTRQLGILLEVFIQHRIPVFQGMAYEADDFLA